MPFDKDQPKLEEARDAEGADFRWWAGAILVSIGLWLAIIAAVDAIMGAL